MSEEPAQYGAERRARGRNALEDTIRAEMTNGEIVKLGGIVAFAEREQLSTRDIFDSLCAVVPGLADVPRMVEERLAAMVPTPGKVIAADFGGDKGRDKRPSTDL